MLAGAAQLFATAREEAVPRLATSAPTCAASFVPKIEVTALALLSYKLRIPGWHWVHRPQNGLAYIQENKLILKGSGRPVWKEARNCGFRQW